MSYTDLAIKKRNTQIPNNVIEKHFFFNNDQIILKENRDFMRKTTFKLASRDLRQLQTMLG